MKKLFLLSALLIFACSSGDDSTENSADPIIGKWQLVDYQKWDVWINEPTDEYDCDINYCPSLIEDEHTWTFNGDGNYSNNLIYRSDGNSAVFNENHYGTWQRGINPGESVEVIQYRRSTEETLNWMSLNFEISNMNDTLIIFSDSALYYSFTFTRVY